MSAVVEKLWELQKVLSELRDKETRLNEKPESFASVDQEFTQASEEMGRFTARLDDLARDRRAGEGDLQDQQEVLKKYQGQLMQVKNQQQYAAAWKEIDNARRHAKDLEEKLLKHMSDADEIGSRLEERREGFEELKARHELAYQEWQHSLSDLRADIQGVQARAARIEEGLDEKIRGEFHRIFKQRQGVAVARVESHACQACRVRVRPQADQQLRRGELTFCEGCRRILFLEATP